MRVTVTLDDARIVPARAVLRPSTYRALAEVAKAKVIKDVGALLSRLADLSITPKAARSMKRLRRTAEEWAEIDRRIRAPNGQSMSDGRIAKALRLPQPTVSLRRRGIDLESPMPRRLEVWPREQADSHPRGSTPAHRVLRRGQAPRRNRDMRKLAGCWHCGLRIDYTQPPGTTTDKHTLDHYYPVDDYPELQNDPDNFRH